MASKTSDADSSVEEEAEVIDNRETDGSWV
jgi:hypothetical protein